MSEPVIDVLVPTYRRASALGATLAALIGQTRRDFRIVVSDQTEESPPSIDDPVVRAVVRVLRVRGHEVELHHHLPRRGLAEQRQFLLERARARYVLYLDDDVILEPRVIERLARVLERERCGFVGSAVIGLSYLEDERPDEQAIEPWVGPVEPETVTPETAAWARWKLHNAANPWHLERRLGATEDAPLRYRVAWVGGCVLYDAAALRAVGGFEFWRDLPPDHAGEDVLAQLRVMQRFGGCGVLPSGAFHQELATTVVDREIDAPRVLPLRPRDAPGDGPRGARRGPLGG